MSNYHATRNLIRYVVINAIMCFVCITTLLHYIILQMEGEGVVVTGRVLWEAAKIELQVITQHPIHTYS